MTQTSTNPAPTAAAEPVETEFLIVGTGPAGAALACFLGSHGRFPSSRQIFKKESPKILELTASQA